MNTAIRFAAARGLKGSRAAHVERGMSGGGGGTDGAAPENRGDLPRATSGHAAQRRSEDAAEYDREKRAKITVIHIIGDPTGLCNLALRT